MERDKPSRPELTSEQIAEAERRSDQGVWNGVMAEAAFTGYLETPGVEQVPPLKKKGKKRKLTDEVSGQEMTRRHDIATPPMSEEERQAVQRSEGHLAFLAERERLAYQNALDKTEGDPQAQRALLRKLADGKK